LPAHLLTSPENQPKITHARTRHSSCSSQAGTEDGMLETIAIILIVLWLLGMVSGYTLGNFIYVLLVIAIVLFLVRLVSGRRVV
jgi:Flp pilus assembly protein TadB